MMFIRKFTNDDIDFLVSSKKDFCDCWNKEMIISSIKNGRFYGLIAEENGEKVAFLTASFSLNDADIESVFTLPAFRKKGIAGELFDFFFSENTYLEKVFLEVRKSNAPAILLYQKKGFSKISERKKYYFDGEDAIVMLKEIKNGK